MTAKGIQPTTGTVHYASPVKVLGVTLLWQNCGGAHHLGAGAQRHGLTEVPETTEVTCQKCINGAARKSARAARDASGTVTPMMTRMLKRLELGGTDGSPWVSWIALDASEATMRKMIAMGLVEARHGDTEYRKI